MGSSWIWIYFKEPIFPYGILYDFSTYLLLSLVFFILYKKKILNNAQLLISIIFLSTPFLFNGFLFDWSVMPDQSKYMTKSFRIRNDPSLLLNASIHDLKILVPSTLYAFSPIVSLETYKGISLMNRALYLLSWIFFSNKRFLDKYNSILFLIIPSLVLYSSVALRDNLLILLMIWFLYFYYNQKYLFVTFVSVLLLIIKFQLIAVIFIFLILDMIFKENRIRYRLLSLYLSLFLVFLYFFNDQLINLLNDFRYGFFIEEYGRYQSISAKGNYEYLKISFDLNSMPIIFNSFISFVVPPMIKGNLSILYFVHLFEVLFLSLYLFLRIKFHKVINFYILLKWFLIITLSYFLFSLVVFNDGTMLRYKAPIFFFAFFGLFVNMEKTKMR